MNEERERSYAIRTVGEIVNYLTKWFDDRWWFREIGIKGEVSGVTLSRDGRLNFALKEDRAIINCVVWSNVRPTLPEIKDGDMIVAVGRLGVHRERGAFNLYVESAELFGLGQLFLRFERLKKQFFEEGLFEAGRRRRVPRFIRKVALVTARGGKGAEDFLKTLRDVPAVETVLIDTRVQGDGAEIDVAEALDRANASGAEVIVLARGGGSYVDLFPFNLEPIVRAIVRSRIPVVTAIGHEPDRHLADEVADLVFGTPSKAAAFISNAWREAKLELRNRNQDLDRAIYGMLERHARGIASRHADVEQALARIVSTKRDAYLRMTERLTRHEPRRVVSDNRERVLKAEGRLDIDIHRRLERGRRQLDLRRTSLDRAATRVTNDAAARLQRSAAGLTACDPLAPLARGYAIVSAGGRVVREAASVQPGTVVTARLERGTLAARVEAVNDDG